MPAWSAIVSGLKGCVSVLSAGYMLRSLVLGYVAVRMREGIVKFSLELLEGLVWMPWLVFGAGLGRAGGFPRYLSYLAYIIFRAFIQSAVTLTGTTAIHIF